jgi:CheY-like chemotaxis protein
MEDQSTTILVAEGDPALRDLIALAVSRVSPASTVITAADGLTALELADLHRPELLLVDVLLPELSGLEVLRRLKKQGQSAPAIAISGLGFREVVQQAVAAGARAFMVKPVDMGLLTGKVQSLMPAQP